MTTFLDFDVAIILAIEAPAPIAMPRSMCHIEMLLGLGRDGGLFGGYRSTQAFAE
jgi:hypothetical protein